MDQTRLDENRAEQTSHSHFLEILQEMCISKNNNFPELDVIHTKILKRHIYETDELLPDVYNLILESKHLSVNERIYQLPIYRYCLVNEGGTIKLHFFPIFYKLKRRVLKYKTLSLSLKCKVIRSQNLMYWAKKNLFPFYTVF